jgi:hypothetical protein
LKNVFAFSVECFLFNKLHSTLKSIITLFLKIQLSRLAFLLILFTGFHSSVDAQVKILFDATKAETAGSADWVIDANTRNIAWGSGSPVTGGSGTESNAQTIPTPAQPAAGITTAETYWDGGLSFWGLDCAYKGYIVESLPAITGKITYNDLTNAQDLSNYKTFVVCEPNITFTATEKTAMLDFVRNGGGLFIISDHDKSDRNNDGFDSPYIWNDFFQTNSTGNTNPFGMIFDLANFSETSTNISNNVKADTLLRMSAGAGWGNVAKVKWSAGTSLTINPVANASVVPIVYQTTGSGNNKVMVAIARYGAGKVVAAGDSSPFDDGTGDPNDTLYPGYNGDVTPNHRNLIMNATIWLVTNYATTYTFNGNGNWDVAANWLNNKIPPANLPGTDQIIIDPITNGQCVLTATQHIAKGGKITVATGKNLNIPGLLTIQ